MMIGVVSDTHDDIENTEKVIAKFKENKVDLVVHLGDYVSPPTLKLFEGLKVVGVFGNNDGYKEGLIKIFNQIGGEIKGDFGIMEVDNLNMALFHGEFSELPRALAKSGDYDVVFYGHSHKFEKSKYGNSLLLNPGSCHRSFTEDEYPTAGIFDTTNKQFKAIDLV
ncbi:MAG: metallophosphoesterase [Archaeoglobaceae archaeon]